MKKYIAVIMLYIMVAFISACSSEKMVESKNMNTYEKTEYIPIKEYADTDIHLTANSEKKCLYYESRFEEVDGKYTFMVKNTYEYDYETGKTIQINSFTAQDYSLFFVPGGKMLAVDADKNLYILNGQYELITETNLQEVSLMDKDSQKCGINLLFDIKSDGKYIYVSGTNTSNQKIVLLLDLNLKEKEVFYADQEWMIIALQGDQIGLADTKKGYLYVYDEEKNKLKNVGKLPKDALDTSVIGGFCKGNAEYDYFYYTNDYQNKDNGIREDYLIGVKSGKQEKILSFTTMGLDDLSIESIITDTQEGFWVWGIAANNETILYHLTLSDNVQDYSTKAGKICCKIGSLVLPDVYMKYAFEEFSRQSEDYYFEIVAYMDMYEDRDIAITHLFLDCQNGTIDGVLLDNIEDELVNNDALYDLENYFTQSTVVSKDRFITHYLESVSDEEGRIYALYPSFKAFGYAYDEQIDFSDLLQYESMCEENKSFLSSQGADRDLEWLLSYSGNKIIDEKNGEVHVKEDAFRSLLQFLKMQSTDKHKNFDCVMQYCEGESSATRIQISEPTDYLYFNELFDKNVVFTNVGIDGLVIGQRKGLLGVCSKSEHKEALFNFYDFLYEPYFYHELFFSGLNMPIFKEEYELWKEYFLATEAYEDKYGKFHRKYDFQIGMGAAECVIKVGSVSEQEAEEAITALQEAKYIKPMKDAYENIITEEASAYFADTQDLDRTCDNIENRLQLALEENKQ